MRASTLLGAAAAAGVAAAVVEVVDRQFGPPRAEQGTRTAALRRFNKRFFNPLILRAAALNLPYPTVVGHVGRRSGTAYETPVAAAPTATGFLVPLPYGQDVDWLRNLLAAGGGTLRYAGETVHVTNPTIVDRAAALAEATGHHRAIWSRLGIADYLRLEPDPGGLPI